MKKALQFVLDFEDRSSMPFASAASTALSADTSTVPPCAKGGLVYGVTAGDWVDSAPPSSNTPTAA